MSPVNVAGPTGEGIDDADVNALIDTAFASKVLNDIGSPDAPYSFNSQRLTGLADPTNDQDAVTKAFATALIAALVDGAPDALNTLSELATALNDDANFSATVIAQIATKLNISLYDANTIVKADTDNTPIAMTVAPSTLVGRGASGNIGALTAAQAKVVLAIQSADISDLSATITTAINAALTAYVAASVYDANTILKADTDNTPVAMTVGASTLVGRLASGSISALTTAQVKALLAIVGADITDLDTDGTLSSNASNRVSSTSAVKTYADTKIPKSIGTSQGDIIGYSASGVPIHVPSTNIDGAQLTQRSSQSAGVGWESRIPVRQVKGVATSQVTLSGFQTIDGIDYSAQGDGNRRILLVGQTNHTQNGIWIVGSGAWSRPTDASLMADYAPSLLVVSEQGNAANQGSVWRLVNGASINYNLLVGQNDLNFERLKISGPVGYSKKVKTNGDFALASTTFAVIDSALDVVLPANVGDVLEVDVNAHIFGVVSGGGEVHMEAATIDGSNAVINYMTQESATPGDGNPAWASLPGTQFNPAGGTLRYTVKSGDIVSGTTVKVRLFAKQSSGATARSIGANTNVPLVFSVINTGIPTSVA